MNYPPTPGYTPGRGHSGQGSSNAVVRRQIGAAAAAGAAGALQLIRNNPGVVTEALRSAGGVSRNTARAFRNSWRRLAQVYGGYTAAPFAHRNNQMSWINSANRNHFNLRIPGSAAPTTVRTNVPTVRAGGSGGGRMPPTLRRLRRSSRGKRSRRSSRGKRSRRSRGKSLAKYTPSSHLKRGVHLVIETSGQTGVAADSAEVNYIGHACAPAEQMILMAVRAICKAVFAMAGVHIRDFDELTNHAGNFNFQYYRTSRSNALDSINVAYTAATSYNTIVGNLWAVTVSTTGSTGLRGVLDQTPAIRPYAVSHTITSGQPPRYFYLDGCKLNFNMFSRLKIQNRTPNGGATDSIDTNDINYLVGNLYMGNGTGTYVKAYNPAVVNHLPFIANSTNGIIRVTASNVLVSSWNFLNHPPETTKPFTRVQKRVSISKFLPGATKYHSIKTARRISFSQLLDSYLKEIEVSQYSVSTVGKFAFFGFQKFIDEDSAVKVSVAYEHELQIGCTARPGPNLHTNSVFIENAVQNT